MLKQLNLLLSSLLEKSGIISNELLSCFIKQFYNSMDLVDIQVYQEKELIKIAENYYNFAQNREIGVPKLRVFNPSNEQDGWYYDGTIIEIVNDDMPFLIDSMNEVFNKFNLEIKHIIHPVIRVQRDENNNLNRIIEGDIAVGLKESMVHIRLEYIADQKIIENLKKELLTVLDTVRTVVKDWKNMINKVEDTINYISTLEDRGIFSKLQNEENPNDVIKFLNWLKDNNFVFLGYIEYDFTTKNHENNIKEVKDSKLGIFSIEEDSPVGLLALPKEVIEYIKEPNILEITKTNRKSLVHRTAHMECISVKKFNENCEVIGEMRFIGLYTSIVYYQSATQIPLIAEKIQYVIKQASFSDNGFKSKELLSTLNAYPRDELFQISKDELLNICLGIVSLSVRPRVRLFIRIDKYERFISCLVFIPKERYNTELRHKIEDLFIDEFEGTISNYYTQVSDSHLARLVVIVKTTPGAIPAYNLKDLEEKLSHISNLWSDEFKVSLNEKYGEKKAKDYFIKYNKSFTNAYKSRYVAQNAVHDINFIEATINNNCMELDLYQLNNAHNFDAHKDFQLKIFNPKDQLSLSVVMPILENLGFHALDELTFFTKPLHSDEGIWIHHFRLTSINNVDLNQVKKNFEEAFKLIWFNEVADDGFNKLITLAGLKYRQVTLIRSYARYLRQAGFNFSQNIIEETLAKHPLLADALVNFFYNKFDPNIKAERKELIENSRNTIKELLNQVENSLEDRIIYMLEELISATLRTNYFQKDANNQYKNYISFKLNSKNIPDLIKPHPYVEIFVYSCYMEGIHLRSGKVARGGLRWSDRQEDFRTEVLGLMKTQIIKNSVIVPIGAKGGFIVKKATKDREEFLQEGVKCYKTLLRGMLDITDNIINDEIVKPQNVICYDENDPYLVVAADKGTATFSNYANEVSLEYNFWLQDAFASGGSAGYDHKKMGITAKGAWISVVRHFLEMGINIENQNITVTGIGDMAGDVFGNGMLLSNKICLVAAFNHMHIFIDPKPNPIDSFNERSRLFNLPRSTWKDYNVQLISKGGGIFERSAKTINLTPEIKELLDIKEDKINPDKLIKKILCANVDLLWNGGIGTYIKSEYESNESVGDKANDLLRINGKDLRCKVVGEGGNLGFTQHGRIEYSLLGGRINGDFIDNSAGVDCSDHEVNLKIAFGKMIAEHKITIAERNKLLEEMQDNVAELVLQDNHLQARAINIAHIFSKDQLETKIKLIEHLEEEGLLDRKLEALPTNEEITRRYTEGFSLTRPELSVLLSFSKLSIYNHLLNSSLPDLEFFNESLINYFPKRLHKDYRDMLLRHPLRQEIISTIVSNDLVNRLGSSFVTRIADETGRSVCDIVRSYIVVKEIFNLENLFTMVENLDLKITNKTQSYLINKIMDLAERMVSWFLNRDNKPLDIETTIKEYKADVLNLFKVMESLFPDLTNNAYIDKYQSYINEGIEENIAKKIALLVAMSSAGDIISTSHKTKLSLEKVGGIYFAIGKKLSIGWIRTRLIRTPVKNSWEKLSIRLMLDDLYNAQKQLTESALKYYSVDKNFDEIITDWAEKENKILLQHYDKTITSIKSYENIDLTMMNLIIKKLGNLNPKG